MTYSLVTTIEDRSGSRGFPAVTGVAEHEVADRRAAIVALHRRQNRGATIDIQVVAEK